MHEDGLSDEVRQEEEDAEDKKQIKEIKEMVDSFQSAIEASGGMFDLCNYVNAIRFLLTYVEDYYNLWEAVQNVVTKMQLTDVNIKYRNEFVQLCKVYNEILIKDR